MLEPAGLPLTVVVLAAGEGTRMRSATPKVLHTFAGRTLLGHVLAAVSEVDPDVVGVVVGHASAEVIEHLSDISPTALPVEQVPRNGTGHAVRVALEALHPDASSGTVLVLPGDAPLLRGATLAALLNEHARTAAAATLLSSHVADPFGYGRVLRTGQENLVERVVEHRDATEAERAVNEVSALVYAFDAALLRDAVGRLRSDNSQGEQYLPDVVSLLMAEGNQVRAMLAPAEETAGVNDQGQLAAAHRTLNNRIIDTHLQSGVRVLDPQTAWVDVDVRIAAGARIGPNVQLIGRTAIATGAVIGPDCTLTDTEVGPGSTLDRVVANRAVIGAGVSIGPFAYLRPGTVLADAVHIGTYVELKNSDVGKGSKVPHLTYVGDASIGEGSNIGAATVFVNYDGVHKHRSRIGNHARTGADTMFIAPVTVGDGAYTAAGSVITADVPPGALAVARGAQRNVEGWVARKRPGTPSAAAAESAARHSEPVPRHDPDNPDLQPGDPQP